MGHFFSRQNKSVIVTESYKLHNQYHRFAYCFQFELCTFQYGNLSQMFAFSNQINSTLKNFHFFGFFICIYDGESNKSKFKLEKVQCLNELHQSQNVSWKLSQEYSFLPSTFLKN